MDDVITKYNYYEYSLNQINCIQNILLKKEILNLYYNDLKSILKDKKNEIICSINNHQSLEVIFNNVDEFYENITSKIIFPGNYVRFYPNIKIYKAQKDTMCHFSGSIIKKNREYCCYYPLLYNITKRQSYKLNKRIKVETYYYHSLPSNLFEFELFYNSLDNSYNFCDKNNELDFYNISCNLGNYKVKKIRKN